MKTSFAILLSGLLLSGSSPAAVPADGPGYRLEFLPGLSEPSVGVAMKINGAGQVAGWSLDTNGNPRAVRWDRRPAGGYLVQDLGTLGGVVSWAYGLNDHGDVVGAAMIETGEEYAFLWRKGTMVNLGAFISAPPLPHGWRTLSQANAINNAGQVVGWSVTDNDTRAFLWQDGVMKELEPVAVFGNQLAAAQDINDTGDVVGWSITGLGEGGAVRWSNGRPCQLAPDAGFAYAINARGQIAGMGQGPVDSSAFLWDRGSMTHTGVESSVVYGLNDSGQAVGSFLSLIDWNNGLFLDSAFIWKGESFQALPYGVQNRSSYAYSVNGRGQVVGAVVAPDWFFNPVLWTKAPE